MGSISKLILITLLLVLANPMKNRLLAQEPPCSEDLKIMGRAFILNKDTDLVWQDNDLALLANPDVIQYGALLRPYTNEQARIYDVTVSSPDNCLALKSLESAVSTGEFSEPFELSIDSSDPNDLSQYFNGLNVKRIESRLPVESVSKKLINTKSGPVYLFKWKLKKEYQPHLSEEVSYTIDGQTVIVALRSSKDHIEKAGDEAEPSDDTEDAIIAPPAKSELPKFRMPVDGSPWITRFFGPYLWRSGGIYNKLPSLAPDVVDAMYAASPRPIPGHKTTLTTLKKYFQRHTGIDFSVPTGTKVFAPYNGVVYAVGHMGCTGNTVIVEHLLPDSSRMYSVYYHLKGYNQMVQEPNGTPKLKTPGAKYKKGTKLVNLKVGHKIEQGEVLAFSGFTGIPVSFSKGRKSGCVQGPHLHFELKKPLTQDDIAEIEKFSNPNQRKRFSHFVGQTAFVNPSEFIPYVDDACYRRRRAELRNAVRLEKAMGKKYLPVMTAGPCSQRTEIKIREEIASELKSEGIRLLPTDESTLPALYQVKSSDQIELIFSEFVKPTQTRSASAGRPQNSTGVTTSLRPIKRSKSMSKAPQKSQTSGGGS
ncbi:MAG: M23 family metallopeptidase [Oligoflexia bacterium]|nr:M23 family metallopeptidase [Oligoflexia bacterium]